MNKIIFSLIAISLVVSAAVANPEFTKIDGMTIEGPLNAVKGGRFIVGSNGPEQIILAEEILSITFSTSEPRLPGKGVVLHMPGGDSIVGKVVSSTQAEIEIDNASAGKLKMPLESILAIEFLGEAKADEAFRAEITANKGASDFVFLANGDRVPGIVQKMDADTITVKTETGEMALKMDRVQGISFAQKNRPAQPEQFIAIIRCAEGTLITGSIQDSPAGAIKIKTLAGAAIELNTQNIIDISFRNGRLIYLSDLAPASTEYKPYFGGDRTWPFQKDKNYDRKPIRIAGKNYQKGVGTFSGMKLVYNLEGKYQKFVSLTGIDDADVNNQGDVTIRILADGKEVFNKTELTKKAGPVKIDVPVAGVKQLELVVEFGGNMHMGDITSWADAHLIKK